MSGSGRAETPSTRAKRVAESAATVEAMAALYRARLDRLVVELETLERYLASAREILAIPPCPSSPPSPDAEQMFGPQDTWD